MATKFCPVGKQKIQFPKDIFPHNPLQRGPGREENSKSAWRVEPDVTVKETHGNPSRIQNEELNKRHSTRPGKGPEHLHRAAE